MVCSLKEPGLAIVDCSDLAKGRKHLQSRCKVQQYTKRVYERGSWVYSVFFFLYRLPLYINMIMRLYTYMHVVRLGTCTFAYACLQFLLHACLHVYVHVRGCACLQLLV